jgi:hypothetical protein
LQSQTFTVNANPQNIDAYAPTNGTTFTTITASPAVFPTTGATCGPGTTTPILCSGTLAATKTVIITFTFDKFPQVTVGTQSLRCAGSIVAADTAQPGFITASGVLTTFVESSEIKTDNTTNGANTLGGIAVYSQIPIVINRAKPF